MQLVRRLADGKLPEPALHRAARRSEGNAFFAEELVSAGADGMPHGLAELLVARVERAGPGHPAGGAGRLGRRPAGPHDQLAAVSGLETDVLEQALRDAVADHVLVAVAGSPTEGDAYAFRHALLREAVYDELLPGERSRIHAGYAALLAAPATGRPSPAGPPSWRTTRWPGTTCRWPSPPRCGRPARPTSGRRRPSCCCMPSAPSSCGARCRTPRRWPGSTSAPSPGGRPGGPAPPVTRTAASRSAGARWS